MIDELIGSHAAYIKKARKGLLRVFLERFGVSLKTLLRDSRFRIAKSDRTVNYLRRSSLPTLDLFHQFVFPNWLQTV